MKKLKMIMALVLLSGGKTLAQQDIEISKYNNQREITANRSITLKPGIFIPAGTKTQIHISSNPGVNIGTNLKSDMNALVTYTPIVPGLVNAADSANGVKQVRVEVQTFDHLGNLKEIQQIRTTPLFNNLVHQKTYDALGRVTTDYLPYVQAPHSKNFLSQGYAAATLSFYSGVGNTSYAVDTTAYPFSNTVYENQQEPFVREQTAPGAAYALGTQHTKRFEYTTVPKALYYRVKNDALIFDSLYFYYPGGLLTMMRSADENVPAYTTNPVLDYQKSGSTVELKDFRGNVVLRRTDIYNPTTHAVDRSFSTYYVYDDKNNLRYVVPPKANLAGTETSPPSQDKLDNLCYQYRYDNQNRLVAKKLPEKGWEYMIYNQQGQVVMTQDSLQRSKAPQEWNIIKYDGQGRVVVTGIYAQAGSTAGANNSAAMQQSVNAQTIQQETRTTAGNGYTANTFPQTWTTTLSLNYYDDYDLPGGNPYPYSGSEISGLTRGLATASKVNVLGTTNMLWTVNYYDEEGRVVKTFKQHYKSGAVNAGNYDEVSNTYDFTGNLLSTTRIHKLNSTEKLKMLTEYTYDPAGRKIDTWETINTTGTRTLIARNDYDELGNLLHKKLHSINNGSSFLQTITYHYNSRGWLTRAQAAKLDLKLAYDQSTHGATPQYNGNISGQEYTGDYSGNQYFSYSYDQLNRLTAASYNNTGTGLSEAVTSYDDNGNIVGLNRGGTFLTYRYGSGNQLTSIVGGTLGGAFTYDGNGNELTDSRRGAILTYNQLNLPATAIAISDGTQHTASYVYDAAGSKLRSVQDTVTRDYIGGIQYTHGAIDFVQTDEGLGIRNPATGAYTYQYNLKDHLGNIRVTIDSDPSTGAARVIQEDEYYAFGLDVPKHRFGTENNYLYNGKEKQDVLVNMLDYGARFYDPVIGRWTSEDPLAEKDRRWSSYSYVHNNPIRNIDIDGLYVKPGDLFTSVDAAAEDFGKYYNGQSIINDKEYRSAIYEVQKDGKTYYSYTPSNDNGELSSSRPEIPKGTRLAGDAHTHDSYTPGAPAKENPNQMESWDVDRANDTKTNPGKVPFYVATPDGSLIKFDPKTQIKENNFRTNMPSDPKDPGRKNDISPYTGRSEKVDSKKMEREVRKQIVAKRDAIPDVQQPN